ncbi:MAG: hypothetical protein ACREN6_06630 [Gemmatimonadaceae bacterium]
MILHRPAAIPSGAGGAVVPRPTGSVALAAEHFAAASFYFVVGAAGLVWIAPDLAAGAFLSPHVAGVTHLFTLGWLTTTIFGALCQLLPVALGAPIRWPRVAHASFWTFTLGAGLFACGVADSAMTLNHMGIALVTAGIVLAAVNIVSSLHRARTRDATWIAIALALTFLISALGVGVFLLHNLHTGFIAAARVRVLATHLHIAVVGWALVVIIGVSHRLLPMFLLAHGAETRWTIRALTMLAAGVPMLAIGLNTPLVGARWVALACLEAGVVCYVMQVMCFFRARVRKHLDVSMRFVLAGLVFLVVAAALGPVVLFYGVAAPRIAVAYVVAGLLGAVALFVCGFLYKIVPLLAWTARYRRRAGKRAAQTIAGTYSARIAGLQLGLMASALSILVVAIMAASVRGVQTGAALFFIGAVLFVGQLLWVTFGGRAGADK